MRYKMDLSDLSQSIVETLVLLTDPKCRVSQAWCLGKSAAKVQKSAREIHGKKQMVSWVSSGPKCNDRRWADLQK